MMHRVGESNTKNNHSLTKTDIDVSFTSPLKEKKMSGTFSKEKCKKKVSGKKRCQAPFVF